jgi:carbon-monoxide dehydrogenase medium subunit
VEDFIQGLGETALGEAEFVDAVLVPTSPGARFAYLKEARGPSGYALTGVAVELLGSEGGIEAVRLGVTGAANRPFRAHAIESLLLGVSAAPELPTDPAAWGAPGGSFLDDEHASAEYRAHILACVARRAVNEALRKR